MEFEFSSAAVLVPQIGEQLSHSLRGLKDLFISGSSGNLDQPALSSIFQSVHEGCSADVITFHHQEEVVTTNDSQFTTFLPMDDLNSLEVNDLFSFVLDDKSAIYSTSSTDHKVIDSPTPCFDAPSTATLCPDLPINLDIPSNVIDFVDFSLTKSHKRNSGSSLSSDSLHLDLIDMNEASPYYSEEDNQYFCENEGDIEQGMPSQKQNRGRSLYDLPLCLHNEDLVCGKPGQRLVLMAEEKRLLVQMGQRVPTMFPLTRSEERAIRIMRRKIRNKLSAKASRARRQEYLSNLESQMEDCHKENERLRYRITELEEDKRGLLTNLRKMRSYMAHLISSSSSLKRSCPKSATSKLPLLPLTVSHRNQRYQSHLQKNSGKSASLMLLAFLILASATTLPLPSLETSNPSKDISTLDQDMLSGLSRVLLIQETELDRKSEASVNAPISTVGKLDDNPFIKTQIHSLNKGVSRVLIQPVTEEQLDPFLLPMATESKSGLMTQVKKGPDIKLKKRLSLPYSVDDL